MSLFELQGQCGAARAGILRTIHGEVKTPAFMPVGTRACVKTLGGKELEELGVPMILGNTYHLYLRPGHRLIERLGGLHRFMSWPHPVLTDSGGFQIFSLAKLGRVGPAGVRFRSHLDGSSRLLTPELSMEVQRSLGSDIVMVLDECPGLPASKESLGRSVRLTLDWARRCHAVSLKPHQHLFGIVQGGLHLDLRQECLEKLEALDFPGLALGGLSVGEKNSEMWAFLHDFMPQMPQRKPRYLMGVGSPWDIMRGIKEGLDMFDCVLPTRNARNGQVFTADGPVSIKRREFSEDQAPLEDGCACLTCRRYSRAYVRHLWRVGEPLAGRLITFHNLWFYQKTMDLARQAILSGTFDDYYQKFYNKRRNPKMCDGEKNHDIV